MLFAWVRTEGEVTALGGSRIVHSEVRCSTKMEDMSPWYFWCFWKLTMTGANLQNKVRYSLSVISTRWVVKAGLDSSLQSWVQSYRIRT